MLTRREAIAATAATAASAALGSTTLARGAARPAASSVPATGAGLRHSVCRWCYGGFSVDDLCKNAKEMGYASVELLRENEYHIPAKYGMECAIAFGPDSIGRGWNRLDSHDENVKEAERLLPLIAAAKIPQMIVFSGNRGGISDEEGLKNCAAGLKRIMPLAESLGVQIIMELLNSKRDHRGYMCDKTPWGVNLVNEVASDRFRLLYDIYHMQIMEGDVIATIREYKDFIGHYHTGGVPGRREIDDSQELYYPAICKAINETGYSGFLGQEFIPARDPMASLKQAIEICTV
ncbi:MAG: TIM barrel protein [Phycisphaerales bacterium]|nr:TIM barrel protein [Phycisphaerales bacterium]